MHVNIAPVSTRHFTSLDDVSLRGFATRTEYVNVLIEGILASASRPSAYPV
jgi:hypothetical protein